MDQIIQTIDSLNDSMEKEVEKGKTLIGSILESIKELKTNSEGKQKAEQELLKLRGDLDKITAEKSDLESKIEKITELNTRIKDLKGNVKNLIETSSDTRTQITNALNTPPSTGGFRYNKKHLKDKRQFQELFSRSNSKTTSKKSKKRRRRPGKSVKKGGMKTRRRRRRRNKKSKKSKKRRK